MISEEYRRLNAALHNENAEYGSYSGRKYADFVLEAMRRTGSRTVLDYGCGKGTLKEVLGPIVSNYDPAIPEWSAEPEQADLVVCTDVLEHVEPEFLDSVIKHIRGLAKRAVFFVVSCRPAHKTLPDGRNAHLTVESADWWIKKLSSKFHPVASNKGKDDLMMVCR